ncbi:hypothetical protein NLG97_g7991 [Lecanicillium saksenae]|uniref:Uncharacterized protein n=1 Tax=Lecanicillium saksenae TaxID=468837 RepID=A0ACC1QLW5_9HYPO|nr:hypothetical protein NLG97_g7991 [Lecanicillium saksenae]
MNPNTQELKVDVSKTLSENAYSISFLAAGVERADGAQLAANNPCEDRFNRFQTLHLWQSQTWVAATIFDGHNGWQTAAHLEKVLLTVVRNKLNNLQPGSRTDRAIQNAIEEIFTDINDSLIGDFVGRATDKDLALEEKVQYMHVALPGSCALLLLYNPNSKTLYTACTGDSRDVLGQQTSDGHWLPEALSEDQNCGNEKETARIRKEHPNEQNVIRNGKVLGMGVTRAFGNFRWKSSYEAQLELGKRFITAGAMNKDDIPTPPYLTARPTVTARQLDAELPAFVVLASDGLWYNCETREAVDLVVRWLEAQPESSLREMNMELRETPSTVWWKKRAPSQRRAIPAASIFLNGGTTLTFGFERKGRRLKTWTMSRFI